MFKVIPALLKRGPDSISVVILTNCEPEPFYAVFSIFNICLKESFFRDIGKLNRSSLHLAKFGKVFLAKDYQPVFHFCY